MVNGRFVEKPWGAEYVWAETPYYVGKVLIIHPKQQLSKQYHRMKDESMMCIDGSCVLVLGAEGLAEETQDAFEGVVMGIYQSYHIPPKTVHRLIAGRFGAKVVEVSTIQLDDIVRLEDRYGRK